MSVRRRGTLFIVSAPSGAGKTTLCERLREDVPHLEYSISVTTRAPRPGEVDGKDFEFVSDARFEELIAADAFAEHALVHGHRYGTRRATIERLLGAGEDILLDIDTQGATKLKRESDKYDWQAVLIFIVAPSMAELEQRLRERRSNKEPDIARRLARAREEIALWRAYDYLIVNRDVKEAQAQLETIIAAERLRTSRLTLYFSDLEVPN